MAAEQEADSKLLKGAEQAIAERNKIYLQDVSNAQAAGRQLVQNAEKTAASIIKARERLGSALESSLSTSRNQFQGSENRVENLKQDQSDRNFDQSISRLNDAQQAFALIKRSEQTAREAAAALEKAAATGNEKEIQQALGLFSRADQTGEQAAQIANRTGNRALEVQAVRNLTSNTNRQIEAEQKLQALEKDRQAQIQALQDKQQASLDVLREQQSIIAKNSNPLDASGNLLNPEQLKRQADAVQAALDKIAKSKLSPTDLAQADRAGVGQQARDFNLKLSQGVTKLNFDASEGVKNVQAQLQTAFKNFKLKIDIDVDALSAAVGRALTTPDEVTRGVAELQDKIGNLKTSRDEGIAKNANLTKLKTDLAGISAALDSSSRAVLRFLAPSLPHGLSAQEKVKSLNEELVQLSNDPALTDEKIANFFQKVADAKNDALSGNVATNVGLAADVRNLAQATELLQQVLSAQKAQRAPADNGTDLQKFDSILKDIQQVNPAGQFSSTATSIANAVQPAEAVAAAWERAASAAQATASAAASAATTGAAAGAFETEALGGFQTFATGGLAKGTDTIPALLSNREHVTNARQSERFHPQLVAINAGIPPSNNTTTSNVTNGINGDVNINIEGGGGADVNVKQIGNELNRLIRRNLLTLKS